MSDRRTAFDAITKDKPTLAGFLRSLPVIEAPWDTAFQKRYCSSCTAENCDACANEQFRNNPEWWLSLPAAEAEQFALNVDPNTGEIVEGSEVADNA